MELLKQWFDAHTRGDMDVARELLADEARVTLPDGTTIRGFDEFMRWYEKRRENERLTSYEVVDLLGGEHHGAAVILLRRAEGVRRQVAVYAISEGRITAVQLFEDDHA